MVASCMKFALKSTVLSYTVCIFVESSSRGGVREADTVPGRISIGITDRIRKIFPRWEQLIIKSVMICKISI
jgi:hypothetical protein